MKISLDALLRPTFSYPRIIFLSAFEEENIPAALEQLKERFFQIYSFSEINYLPASLLKSNLAGFLNTLASRPLFGNPPLYVLEKVTEGLLANLEKLLLSTSSPLILTGGYFKTTSALRVFCEKSKEIAFVTLTSPTPAHLHQSLLSLFTSYNQTPTPALIKHLVQIYTEKPSFISCELTPFCFLKPQRSTFSIEDYKAFTSTQSVPEDRFIEAYLSKKSIPSLDPNNYVTLVGFIRLLNFYLVKLLEYRTSGNLPKGMSLHYQDLFKTIHWKEEEILNALFLTNQMEKKGKMNATLTLIDLWEKSNFLSSLS